MNKGCSLGSINRRYTEHILRLMLHQTAISLSLIKKNNTDKYVQPQILNSNLNKFDASFIISGLNIMRRGSIRFP